MLNNPNAPLICGIGKSLGRHLLPISIFKTYEKYKKKIFPDLLESPNVTAEDKQKIRELLKKPFNPYVMRHSALTHKRTFLKGVLRQIAGWTQGSQMHQRYVHYLGTEATNSILAEYGLIDNGLQLDPLKSKTCTNCSEPNKPDSKFCANCRMVLTYDAYNETLDDKQQKDDAFATLSDQLSKLMAEVQELKKNNNNNRN